MKNMEKIPTKRQQIKQSKWKTERLHRIIKVVKKRKGYNIVPFIPGHLSHLHLCI
jgi:hypothetical protein